MKSILAVAMLFIVLHPATAQPSKLEALAKNSRVIVTGRVVDIESRWDSKRKSIFTYITIDVTEVLKGRVDSKLLVIEQRGGRFEGRSVWTIGSPVFKIGEEVLLHLNPNAEGVLRTAYLGQGKISLSHSDETLLAHISPKQYIESLKAVLKNIEDSSPIDYKTRPEGFVAGQGEHLDEFNLSGARFFEPDEDRQVNFSVNSDRAPVPGGGIAQVNAAMAAWNAAGSRLKLNNAGSTRACGSVEDRISTVSFGDCLKEIDDPVDGLGTLSIVTLVIDDKQKRIFNGQTFERILEADIVYANGLDDLLGRSNNLEELMARNLGLAFGLNFSSTNEEEPDPLLRQSIMYFKPFFDGRGAKLNTDDLNAVNRLYPLFTRLSIPEIRLATPVLGVQYNQGLQAAGGFPEYTFAITSGTLPQGLELTRQGLITGTPQAVETQTFTVTVTDSALLTASRSFTLAVTTLPPLIFSVTPSRLCNNQTTKLTVNGTGFRGVNSVSVSSGSITSFRIIDNNTLEVNVKGPGRPGSTADLTVTNPGGSNTLRSSILYAGPFIQNATIGKVQVRNDKGNLVNKRGITVSGIGIGFDQTLIIAGKPATDLKINRFSNEDYVFYGTLSGLVPEKGDFDIELVEPKLNNCLSNTFRIKRKK
ncbi:MAG: putative Ig domain-containing protein [Acidobacteriota bacterium]|nr:putative Ig domain-containing protein [Blastocatellia bacterium]MDW8413589.1 putative Ig domain-containing protein [Acidobacteriota bacterium]